MPTGRPAQRKPSVPPESTPTNLDPIPGIIPFGSLCMFSGASAVGKTILKSQWCAAFLQGHPILGHATNRPTEVCYLAVDRPWHPTYSDTFRAAGIPEIKHHCLMDPDSGYDPRILRRGPGANPRAAFDLFVRCMEALDPALGALVFVDPLAPLLIQGDQNNARDVAVSLQWIRRCGQKHQVTLLCDANVTKLKAEEDFKRAQDRISGSGAFLAYSDTTFNFTQDEQGSPVRTLSWQPRRAPSGEMKFTFDPETALLVPYTGLQDEGETADTDRPTQVLALFPPEPEEVEFGEIFERAAQTLGISRATLKRDFATLQKRGLIEHGAWGTWKRRKLS